MMSQENTQPKNITWRSIITRFIPSTKSVRRVGKLLVLCGLIVIGVVMLMTVVFWNADFYALRDRWEHFKLALNSEWVNECPPKLNFNDCERFLASKKDIEDVVDFHLFKESPIEGTGLIITTGARFETVTDIVHENASMQWCYIQINSDSFIQKIELAAKVNDKNPVYSDIHENNNGKLRAVGLSAQLLRQKSLTHCKFNFFKNEGSTDVI